ncbi:MAG TPA: DUF5719 family protein [Acidimicrobiales bacterium]|nr:DUF5719 family protein [Acidimicrobiales bacterium]
MAKHRRHLPLLLVVVVVLAATGVLTSLRHSTNPSTLPSGLTASLDAESTALYCTGLSSVTDPPGRVTFYNTSGASRSLSLSIVSQVGKTYTSTIELPAHAAQSIQPSVLDSGTNFGVAVQISGGGVVGNETAGSNRAEVPCQSTGVRHWYATGFDTLVGSSAYLSLYNPTGTAAVLNATIYTGTGFSAPQSFQGLSIPAHAQTQINLGGQVVNTANVGVGIDVLRGSLVVVGVQDSNGEVSFDQGVASPLKAAWFPDVTTVNHATAQIRVANPNAASAQVTVNVALSKYTVAPQTLSVAPFSTSLVNITPNSAIPAAGYASLTLRSSEPVVTSLATGQGTWTALSAPQAPGRVFLIRDFTGRGFDAATITNTSPRTISVTITTQKDKATKSLTVTGQKVSGDTTESLLALLPASLSTQSQTFIVSSLKPSLVVGLTLPSKPNGVLVVEPLNGG